MELRAVAGCSVDVDGVVIGTGVIGLACAAALAPGRALLVLERHVRHGTESSARNSGVIHAGLYYPPGSRKARVCVEGREKLYDYAARRGVAHRRTGKLVLAVEDDEVSALEGLAARAQANGVRGLNLLDAAELRRREPRLRAQAALHVQESGVVDAHGLMSALKVDARSAGAHFAFRHAVRSIEPARDALSVVVSGPEGEVRVRTRFVVNAAGHGAAALASRESYPWVGRYFVLRADAPRPETALVYPLPVVGGLGIHLTRDLGGQTLAGPDALPGADLEVPASLGAAFARSVRRFLPGLRSEHLTPGYAGVRPKLRADGAFADFLLEEGPPGAFHLLGIESPGLTSALALADEVAALVRDRGL